MPDGRSSTRPPSPRRRFAAGDVVGDERLDVDAAPGQPHVAQHLGHGHHDAGEVGERAAGPGDDVAEVDAGEDAVAGGGEVALDHVAGLLAAEGPAAGLERVEHVAVADGGVDDVDAALGHRLAEAEVRHHRDDDGGAGQRLALLPVDGEHGEDAVAVDDVAVGVDGDAAVGVAVEGEADVGAEVDDGAAEVARVGRAAPGVDVGAVRAGVRARATSAPRDSKISGAT